VKVFIGLIMLLLGLLGLACTTCGALVLPGSAIGLIGIVPGALLIWAAYAIGKSTFGSPGQQANAVSANEPGDADQDLS